MGVILLGFEAEGFLLGETLRPGTDHALRGVVLSMDDPLRLALQIDAPPAVVDRILDGLSERYQLSATATLASPTQWVGHIEAPTLEPIFTLPFYQNLRALLPFVKRVFASFQGGHGTMRIETNLPSQQLEALRSQLAPADAPGVSILIRDQLELSDQWTTLLNLVPA